MIKYYFDFEDLQVREVEVLDAESSDHWHVRDTDSESTAGYYIRHESLKNTPREAIAAPAVLRWLIQRRDDLAHEVKNLELQISRIDELLKTMKVQP